MATPGPAPHNFRLNHSLLGHPPFEPATRVTIPEEAEITIKNYDHTLTDSLITWNGSDFIVHKDSLITFAEPI